MKILLLFAGFTFSTLDSFSQETLALDEVHFTAVWSVAPNGQRVGLEFLRQGNPWGIFDFETQTVDILDDGRMNSFGRYTPVTIEAGSFAWLIKYLPINTGFITDVNNEFVKNFNLSLFKGWQSSWRVREVHQPKPLPDPIWLCIKDKTLDQFIIAHCDWAKQSVKVVYTAIWNDHVRAFPIPDSNILVMYGPYTGKVQIFDLEAYQHGPIVRPEREPIPKKKIRPRRAKYRWVLGFPNHVKGVTYFQYNRYTDVHGDLLPKLQQKVLAWDGKKWDQVKLYPLAFYKGKYLAYHREEYELTLVSDLNEDLVVAE